MLFCLINNCSASIYFFVLAPEPRIKIVFPVNIPSADHSPYSLPSIPDEALNIFSKYFSTLSKIDTNDQSRSVCTSIKKMIMSIESWKYTEYELEEIVNRYVDDIENNHLKILMNACLHI